jgi:hypothetical protein
MGAVADQIVEILSQYTFDPSSEMRMHAGIADLLTANNFDFVTEHQFSRKDRIDFFIQKLGIGIECKIKGGELPLISQVLRYAQYPEVKEIIVVTTKPYNLPLTANSKPVHRVLSRKL